MILTAPQDPQVFPPPGVAAPQEGQELCIFASLILFFLYLAVDLEPFGVFHETESPSRQPVIAKALAAKYVD